MMGSPKKNVTQHAPAFNEKCVNESTNKAFNYFNNHDTFEKPMCEEEKDEKCANVKEITWELCYHMLI